MDEGSRGGWFSDATPPEPYRSIQREVFWRDRRWLEAHPVGASYERDYVPGEFWSEDDFGDPSGVERIRVWWTDLFEEPTPDRGYIRMRQPLPRGGLVVSDAEDSANWMFREGPPDD